MAVIGSPGSFGAADSTGGYGGRGIPTGLFISPSTSVADQLAARANATNAAADARRLAAAHAASMAAYQKATQIAALQKAMGISGAGAGTSTGSTSTGSAGTGSAGIGSTGTGTGTYTGSGFGAGMNINPADIYARAQSIAQGYLAPQIGYVNQATNLGRQAIAGFTNDFLNKLQGSSNAPGLSQQLASDYNRSIAQQSALSDAISGSLGGQARDQSALLAAVNAPQASANQLNQTEAGFQNQGNVIGGMGGLTASSLLGERAAQQAMAKEIPSVVQLGGQQALGRFLTQQALAKNQIASQLPAQTGQIASTILSNMTAQDKANALIALATGRLDLQGLRIQNAATNAANTAAKNAVGFIRGLKNATQTVTDKAGKRVTTSNPVGYNSAIQQTLAAYPQLSPQDVIDRVNTVYKWGNGRALLTPQRQALTNAGLSPDVSMDSSGRPFLTLQQATALKNANALTPGLGQVGSDGNFYLAG